MAAGRRLGYGGLLHVCDVIAKGYFSEMVLFVRLTTKFN